MSPLHSLKAGLTRPWLLALPGALALLLAPAWWLVQTWLDPARDGLGAWVAAACAGLMIRSVLSGSAAPDARQRRLAIGLLLGTAALRLIGRVMAVHIIGALALVVDVWALGLALGLARRPWPVRPGALALLFAFALPLEQTLQRVVGFPLRQVATVCAETLVGLFDAGVQRAGTLLSGPGFTLSVDLPCSGARGLVLIGALACALACVRTLSRRQMATLLLVGVLGGALGANTLRIAGLYAGVSLGWPVALEPWHSLIGLVALGCGALPALLLAGRRPLKPAPAQAHRVVRPLRTGPALAFSAVALAVALAPAHPLDVAPVTAVDGLPGGLGPWLGQPSAASAQESAYFTRFGGALHKMRYRDPRQPTRPPITVLQVHTTAPLRHLHGPDACLAGAGHQVERLGVRADRPVVVWRSTDPEGGVWRVQTLFVSARGEMAATVSEVVWRWARSLGQGRPERWSLVEWITPWSTCDAHPGHCADFERALATALDWPPIPEALTPEALTPAEHPR